MISNYGIRSGDLQVQLWIISLKDLTEEGIRSSVNFCQCQEVQQEKPDLNLIGRMIISILLKKNSMNFLNELIV